MEFLKKFIAKYGSISTFFKSFFLLVVVFLVFFGVNLFISIKNKSESAYTALENLNKKKEVMLQDTRVHNWSELEKKKQ